MLSSGTQLEGTEKMQLGSSWRCAAGSQGHKLQQWKFQFDKLEKVFQHKGSSTLEKVSRKAMESPVLDILKI